MRCVRSPEVVSQWKQWLSMAIGRDVTNFMHPVHGRFTHGGSRNTLTTQSSPLSRKVGTLREAVLRRQGESFSSFTSPADTEKGDGIKHGSGGAQSSATSGKTLLHQVSLNMLETIAENEECIENKHADLDGEEKPTWQDMLAFMTPIQTPDTIFENGDSDLVEEIFSVIAKPSSKPASPST